MRGILVHSVLAIFILSGGLAADRLAASSVKHATEEDSSSARMNRLRPQLREDEIPGRKKPKSPVLQS
jgi:hypothetical protein